MIEIFIIIGVIGLWSLHIVIKEWQKREAAFKTWRSYSSQ